MLLKTEGGSDHSYYSQFLKHIVQGVCDAIFSTMTDAIQKDIFNRACVENILLWTSHLPRIQESADPCLPLPAWIISQGTPGADFVPSNSHFKSLPQSKCSN